jgi:hypothetical protein
MNLRIRCLAAIAILCLTSAPTWAANAQKKYCLNATSGGSSCAFDSLEQCQATAQGRNGWCSEQVDFGNWSAGRPENSLAYYPHGGETRAKRKLTPEEQDLEQMRKNEMPAKGVGAE